MKLWKVEFIDRWSQPDFKPIADKRAVHVIAETLAEVESVIYSHDVHHANGYNRWNEIISVALIDDNPPYSINPIHYKFS